MENWKERFRNQFVDTYGEKDSKEWRIAYQPIEELEDFISQELDKAREEGRDEGINAVLYPKFRRNENGTLKREGWVENCKISESPRPTGEEDWKKTLTDILQQEVTQEAMAEGNKTPEQEAVDFIEQELSKAREEGYQKGWKDGRSKAQEEFANWRRSR